MIGIPDGFLGTTHFAEVFAEGNKMKPETGEWKNLSEAQEALGYNDLAKTLETHTINEGKALETIKPEPHDMGRLAEGEMELWEAIQNAINKVVLDWAGSEEMEIYNQLAPRLNFIVPFQLQPFIGAIYKLAYADGMEQGKRYQIH